MKTAVVEVFITNVQNKIEADYLIDLLSRKISFHQINFDLEDSDRILRIKANEIDPFEIMEVLNAHNFICKVLN